MLPLSVRGYLAEIMEIIYTRSELEVLSMQFGVSPEGRNKLEVALNLCKKCPQERINELIERVISDFRHFMSRYNYDVVIFGKDPKVRFQGLLRAIETEMFYQIGDDGKLIPIVEKEVKEVIKEERSYITRELEKLGLKETVRLYNIALATFPSNPIGSLSILRLVLEHMVEYFLERSGRKAEKIISMREKIEKLKTINILRETRKKDLEVNVIYGLYGMLSEYGTHLKEIMPETLTYLYYWSIITIAFLLHRHKEKNKGANIS